MASSWLRALSASTLLVLHLVSCLQLRSNPERPTWTASIVPMPLKFFPFQTLTEPNVRAVHRKLLMAMTNHIQGALTKLLHSWEQDETGSYKDSFIMSDACQHHVDNDHVSDVYSCNNLDLQIESAQVWHSTFRQTRAACGAYPLLRAETGHKSEYAKETFSFCWT